VRGPAAVALAALSAAGLLEQAQQPAPTFRANIDVVRLDVSVLDKDRRPIVDLTQTDFTILVDGVPQPIASFEPVVIPPAPPVTTAWMRDIVPDVRSNALGEPRLIVILMDDATTPTDLLMVATAKKIANRIVDELSPSDLAAVVFTLNNSHAQDFTSDQRLLHDAVEHFSFGIRGTDLPSRYAQRTLADTMKFLRARPHGRNAVMLLTSSTLSTAETKGASIDTPLTEAARALDQLSVVADIEAFGGAARYAPVPIYSFNIAGLAAPNASAAAGERTRGITGAETNYSLDEAKLANDVLRTLAGMTGGRAIVDNNDPARAVPAVLQEISAYYTIAYRATYPVTDGKPHRLQVRVDRPGVTVLPSDRILTSERPAAASATAPPPLLRAVSDIVPASELPMQVTLAPFLVDGAGAAGGATVLTTLRVRRAAPSDAETDEIQVLAKAFTPEGREVASVRQNAALKLRPADEDAQLDILTPVPLKPGRYSFRFSAHSVALGKTGSVYADVTVPDFAKEPVSLSGVLLTADPAAIAAPKAAFARFVPVLPTSGREFAADGHASAFLRVYQRVKNPVPVDVSIRVVDSQGKDVATKTERLAPDRFASGVGVDVTYELPLKTLAPGNYLLSITATRDAKSSARRDVRFSVH
jgi:VWFA-related protein